MGRCGLSAIVLSFAMAAGLCAPVPAHAGAKTSTKTLHYVVSGRSGAEIASQMDRHGPSLGWFGHAVAQTRYSMEWDVDVRHAKGICHVRRADISLSITYTYPRLSGQASPTLKQRWKAFMAGVKRHEEVHGRLARQMANAVEKGLLAMSTRESARCGKLHRAMERRVNAIYADYNARQDRFDAIEHSPGGSVDKLFTRLLD